MSQALDDRAMARMLSASSLAVVPHAASTSVCTNWTTASDNCQALVNGAPLAASSAIANRHAGNPTMMPMSISSSGLLVSLLQWSLFCWCVPLLSLPEGSDSPAHPRACRMATSGLRHLAKHRPITASGHPFTQSKLCTHCNAQANVESKPRVAASWMSASGPSPFPASGCNPSSISNCGMSCKAKPWAAQVRAHDCCALNPHASSRPRDARNCRVESSKPAMSVTHCPSRCK